MDKENQWSEINKDVADIAKKVKSKIDEEDLVEDLKDSFKNIEDLTDKNLYKTYNEWQKWLLTFRSLSKNTALSYGYDFKYFLNFIRLHYEKNKITFSVLNSLKVQDYRSWISFLNSSI